MANEVKQAEEQSCPLTPALLHLLEDTIALGTTNNKKLAEHRNCSEETIKSIFRRINALLSTRSRSEAVIKTITCGWVEKER